MSDNPTVSYADESAPVTLTGSSRDDVLRGSDGHNIFYGGQGNDTFYIRHTNDRIIENRNEGLDTVYSHYGYTLPAEVENFVLEGSAAAHATGNHSDNTLTGNDNRNRLVGGHGNDTLYGLGGVDTLIGGIGDDKLYGGDSRDFLIGQNGNDLLDGGTGNDALTGGEGNDVLNGGEGADSMNGGHGDDVYYVDHAEDRITEEADQGTDTVYSSISYTAPAHVEHIVLTGTDAVNATGNHSDNTLTGNDNRNRLVGGHGNDTLYGLGGVDTLIGGIGDDKLYGGDSRDFLIGQNGNDLLDGGTGNDALTGGAGSDTYYFDKGYGHDVVHETDSGNTVRFGAGITANGLTVKEQDGKWVITLKDTGDTLTIENQSAGADAAVTRFEFSDGLLSNAELAEAAGLLNPQSNVINGTENDDRLEGTEQNDVLNGLGGHDILRGGKGADTADGGSGDDALVVVGNLTAGSKSANKAYDNLLSRPLSEMKGTDYAEVAAGDVLRGGEGSDTLYVFGTTDLSKAVLEGIEKIDMPSDVLLSADQLTGVNISGDGVGTLRIKEESATKTVVLGEQQLNGVKQLDIGKNVVIEVKNPTALNGVEIISGSGTLRFTETSSLSADHSVAGGVKVVNADGSSATGSAELLDRVVSAGDEGAVRGEINSLPYKDMLPDSVTKGNNPVTILDGSDGNDYIEGGSTHDALSGMNGDDVLVGKDGNDIFVINGTGKKTIIDGGSNQDSDTIVLSNATQGAEIDLSQFKGSIGSGTTIQIGAADSRGVAGSAGDKTNLMLIIDRSGSMGWDRMQNAKDAAIKLIEKYNQLGDIAIRIIGFDHDSYVEFNGVNAWMNKTDAINAINTLYASGGTDYYVALNSAETAFVSGRGSLFHNGGKNFSMFLSDGEPYRYIDMTRQTQWEDFVIKHKIVSHAIGFGGIYNTAALEPIAFDGTAVADTAADRTPGQISPILEGDIDKLVTTVSGTAKTDFIENVAGTAFDDRIIGNSLNNEIRAGGGNDIVQGGGGNDVLNGGSGNDVLRGEAGDDTYVFGTGYGNDTVSDTEGSNTVRFDGISTTDISIVKSNGGWVVTINKTGDTLTIENQTDGTDAAVTRFEFSNGTFDNAEMAKLITAPALPSFGGENIVAGSSTLNAEVRSHNLPQAETAKPSGSLLDNGSGTIDSALDTIVPARPDNIGTGSETPVYYGDVPPYTDDSVQYVPAV